jgi:hypothetical protein
MSQLCVWGAEEIFDTNDVVGIDLDGTLTLGGYPQLGEPNPYVVKLVQALKERGAKIVIHSCRTNENLRRLRGVTLSEVLNEIDRWLRDNNIEVDGICVAEKPVWSTYIGDEAYNAQSLATALGAPVIRKILGE